jgi:hypothetical protein
VTAERRLPLDAERYREYVEDLREVMEEDLDLVEGERLRDFVHRHRRWFGPRTARVTLDASDDHVRLMLHVAVLAASELLDLHAASREWLGARGHSLPPWDVTVPRTPSRLVTFDERVYGVVEFEPQQRVELDPALTESERRWATALAVGIGSCPQWRNEEVWRYAAYLVMDVDAFAAERDCPDVELAERYGVPVNAVRFRRTLPDEL